MRILFCNKYNYPFSGTEVYLFELMELMRSHGPRSGAVLDGRSAGRGYALRSPFCSAYRLQARARMAEKARLAAHAIYSQEARRRMRAMIEDFRPDVAHVRNIYHHLSPSILWELKAQKHSGASIT